MEKNLSKFARIREYVKWLKGITCRAKLWQPQIIHWQFGFFSFLDYMTTRYLRDKSPRARVVITLHDARPVKPTINNVFARKSFFRTADGIIVHSEDARRDFQGWFGATAQPLRVKIIAHGPYSAPKFQDSSPDQIRGHFGLAPRGPVIIAIGSINENKDLGAGIRLVNELQKLCPEVNLFIGGSSGGQDLSPLEEFKKQALFPEKIVILDRYLSDEEVDQAHRIADFSLLFYKVSATSGAAIRSMCAGVPVICNDRPGFRAVVKDGLNGFMVKEDNPSWEARRISQALEDSETLTAMKKSALTSYQDVTWDQVAQEHLTYYKELLATHA
jgi:glycosyltransferase involved in cell wall biosynthesis